jgi:putative transcriptional regulator
VVAVWGKIDPRRVARWPSNDRSGTWRSSARDAPGVSRALTRLGKRIRALRQERKLTQEEAAETAKLDEKHWQDIEGARTNPTVATLVGVSRALKVTLSELFDFGTEK